MGVSKDWSNSVVHFRLLGSLIEPKTGLTAESAGHPCKISQTSSILKTLRSDIYILF